MSRRIEVGNIPGITENVGQTRWVVTDEGSLGYLEVRLEYKGWFFWRKLEYMYPELHFDPTIESTESMVEESKKRLVAIVMERWRRLKDREEFFK